MFECIVYWIVWTNKQRHWIVNVVSTLQFKKKKAVIEYFLPTLHFDEYKKRCHCVGFHRPIFEINGFQRLNKSDT